MHSDLHMQIVGFPFFRAWKTFKRRRVWITACIFVLMCQRSALRPRPLATQGPRRRALGSLPACSRAHRLWIEGGRQFQLAGCSTELPAGKLETLPEKVIIKISFLKFIHERIVCGWLVNHSGMTESSAVVLLDAPLQFLHTY